MTTTSSFMSTLPTFMLLVASLLRTSAVLIVASSQSTKRFDGAKFAQRSKRGPQLGREEPLDAMVGSVARPIQFGGHARDESRGFEGKSIRRTYWSAEGAGSWRYHANHHTPT